MKIVVTVREFGVFTFELMPRIAPAACERVVKIAGWGLYDGRRIERLEPGFVLQPVFFDGTDPVMDELIDLEAKTIPENGRFPFERGTVAMAGTQDKACASQYFVTLGPKERLNGNFTVIGRITDGWDTIGKIESVKVAEGTIMDGDEAHHFHYPEKDIVIESVRAVMDR